MPPWLFLASLYCTTQRIRIKDTVHKRPLLLRPFMLLMYTKVVVNYNKLYQIKIGLTTYFITNNYY